MKILLLDVPGLHLGYLGCYGNDWVATPNLDRLASESVVFDRHYAGLDDQVSRARAPCLRAPCVSGGILPVHFVKPESGAHSLDGQFAQTMHAIATLVKKNAGEEECLVWAELPSLAPPWHLAKDRLDGYFEGMDDAEPWPDPPTKLPAADANLDRLRFTYAAVVTFFDAHLGALMEHLRKDAACGLAHSTSVLDQMLLVLTSSQGLPLGEHGWIGRQRAWQHEECVHLPLLMRLPQAAEAGERIGALTQPADIVPTLLDFLTIRAGSVSDGPERAVADASGSDGDSDGRSLWPLINNQVSQIHPFACSGDRVGDSVEWSLRTLEWAFLLPISTPAGDGPREPKLYVKPDDRWEVNDLRQHHLEEAERMEKTLRDFVRDHGSEPRP